MIQKISREGRLLLRTSTLAAAVAAITSPVLARKAAVSAATASSAAKPAVDEIVVTASRAARDGSSAPTPTTVIGTADLQARAVTSVGDIMVASPQFQPSTTPATTQFGGAGFGGNYFNLRGLGTQRTLLLVDGRRHVATSNAGVIDSNAIPVSLVERVEVVTGGASAAWGSDAVAGVVNLILKKQQQGFEATIQSGISTHGDNQDKIGSLSWGTNFDGGRGHLIIAGEAEKYDGVLHQYDRDWARGQYGVISNPGYTTTNGQPRQLIVPNFQFSNLSENGLITSGPLKGTEFLPGGGTRAFTYGQYVGATNMSGGSGVNLAQYTPLSLPRKRYNAYGRTSYDIADNVTLYGEGSYSKSRTDVSQMLIPLYQANITIRGDNAYLPAAVAAQIGSAGSFTMGRLNTDFMSAGQSGGNETVRGIAGIQGKFGSSWRWNAYYEYGRSRFDNVEYQDPITANFTAAVDAVRDPATGNIVCRSTLTNPGNGCVPVNLFGYGSPSAAAIKYITGVSYIVQHLTENVASADLRGEPFSTWAGPVSIAAGAEYRDEKLVSQVDAISAASGYLYGNPKATGGQYNVKEAFGEVIVPLARDIPFIKALDLNGAVRYTDYSLSGSVVTWKAGLTWSISDALRFRGTRSRDIRAPNFGELYPTPKNAFSNVIEGNTSYRAQTNVIGNQALRPEKADTTTLGVIVQPPFLSGFRASVDYYNIDIKGAIGTFTAQAEVDLCNGGNTAFCGLIVRDGTGAITAVNTQYINFSSIKTRGVDVEASYRLPLSRLSPSWTGAVRLRALTTYVAHLITTTGPTSIDRAGEVGPNNGGVPHWRGNVIANYEKGPISAQVEWRWVGGGKYDNTYGPLDINNNQVRGRNYTNLSLQYRVETAHLPMTYFVAINNLFDRSPPIAPATGINPSQTNAALYDVVGRNISVGLRTKF